MKTEDQTKKLDNFQSDLIKKPECILGGVGEGDGDGDIDRDKAGRIPTQGH